MRLRAIAIFAAALSLIAGAADAQTTQTTKKRVARDGTIIVSRGEDGRSRTRIVVQKRSYLDPGTQVFPGEVRYNDSIQAVQMSPSDPFRGTPADRDRETLPRFAVPLPGNLPF